MCAHVTLSRIECLHHPGVSTSSGESLELPLGRPPRGECPGWWREPSPREPFAKVVPQGGLDVHVHDHHHAMLDPIQHLVCACKHLHSDKHNMNIGWTASIRAQVQKRRGEISMQGMWLLPRPPVSPWELMHSTTD